MRGGALTFFAGKTGPDGQFTRPDIRTRSSASGHSPPLQTLGVLSMRAGSIRELPCWDASSARRHPQLAPSLRPACAGNAKLELCDFIRVRPHSVGIKNKETQLSVWGGGGKNKTLAATHGLLPVFCCQQNTQTIII